MEGSITNLALILYNSVEYIMQGRMPKFSNSLILDKKNLHAFQPFRAEPKVIDRREIMPTAYRIELSD